MVKIGLIKAIIGNEINFPRMVISSAIAFCALTHLLQHQLGAVAEELSCTVCLVMVVPLGIFPIL